MSEKKLAGYRFVVYKGDHGFHVHVFKDNDFLGRWDIENQTPMEENFKVPEKLKKALTKLGYRLEK